jgi:hypothetical protein
VCSVQCLVPNISCFVFRFRGLTLFMKVLSARSLSRKKLIASQGLRKGLASMVRYLTVQRSGLRAQGLGEREKGRGMLSPPEDLGVCTAVCQSSSQIRRQAGDVLPDLGQQRLPIPHLLPISPVPSPTPSPGSSTSSTPASAITRRQRKKRQGCGRAVVASDPSPRLAQAMVRRWQQQRPRVSRPFCRGASAWHRARSCAWAGVSHEGMAMCPTS